MAPSAVVSGFKAAKELTTQTIDRRAARYRNLVVLLVLLVLGSLLWAVLQFSWLPLLALLALLPLCGLFFFVDTWFVNRWRQRILEMWTREQLDVDAFAKAIRSIRLLPPGTLQAMLGSLPTRDHVPMPVKPSPALRQALAATLKTIHRCENDRTGGASIAYVLAGVAVILAVLQESWFLLACALLAGPALIAAWGMSAARWRRWRQVLFTLEQQEGLEITSFVEAAAQLDWGSVSKSKKQRLLRSLNRGA